MIGTKVEPTHEGTPQGGPLSPLLANVLLNELDKEPHQLRHRQVARLPMGEYE